MKVIHVIKKLNNTELNKGGTNDSYVMIPRKLNVSDLFPEVNQVIPFIFKKNGDIIRIRHTQGGEKRIVGLGEFYRKNQVCAGDEVMFERQILHGESRYYIDLKQKTNTLVLQKLRDGFVILTPERMGLFAGNLMVNTYTGLQPMKLEFLASVGKRKDSPNTTDLYDLKVGGFSVANDYASKRMVEIELGQEPGRATMNEVETWRKYSFSMEDEDG